MALLLVGTGVPSAWAFTLAASSLDSIVDTTDPQNGTGDLAVAFGWTGESFADAGESRAIVVLDMTGIDNTKLETATLTLEVRGGPWVLGTGAAEVDVTLLTTPLASHTDDAPSVTLYEAAGTVVDTIDTSAGGGTYTTVDISTALKALDLSTNKLVVFRIETTAAITWPITANNAIRVWDGTGGGATALDYTLAGEGYLDGFSQSIYMGHSFFNPGTLDIAVLAPFLGFSRHTQFKQIAGGTNGDPGSLWRDTGENELAKAEIKKGNVEIVGMTWTGDVADNEFEDYTTWIDFILQYNADTFDTFFIQTVWASYTNNPTYALHRATQDLINAAIHDIVQQLRTAYPQLTILAVPVGEAMSRLWLLFDQGQLGPEILGVKIDGNPENSLQIDNIGHAGNIMEDTIGLIWQQTIYPETDIRTVSNPPTYQFNWTYDIRQLAYDIVQDDPFAQRPGAVPANVPAAGGLGLALGAGLLALGGAVTVIRRRQ